MLNHNCSYLNLFAQSFHSDREREKERERLTCLSYTTCTSSKGPNRPNTSLRSRSWVYKLRPKIPKHLVGSGLSFKQTKKKQNQHKQFFK